MEQQPRVVVTGIGLVTSLGLSAREVWERSLRGESGIGTLQRFDVSGHACRSGAAVPDFDLTSSLRLPKYQKFMNRAVKCAVRAAKDAITASHIELSQCDPDRIAVHVGSGQTALDPAEFFAALTLTAEGGQPPDYKKLGGRPSRLIDRYFPLRTLSNAGVGLLSTEIGARGPGSNFVQTDTASALAIATAWYDLMEGRCDVALAGGYESLLTVSNYLSYEKAGLLSVSPPGEAYRPFDQDRDGLVLGEGAGFLVLERLEDARRRAAPILGEFAGFSSAMDVSDSLEPLEYESVIHAAWQEATGDSPVDFIIAHGIGTAAGDRREAAALSSLFGRSVPITALKSHTGYLGAATAAVEIGLGFLSIQHGMIPCIARLREPDPDFSLDFVAHEARRIHNPVPAALCLSWSWAGQCTAVFARAFRE